jgi:hypothetical protein
MENQFFPRIHAIYHKLDSLKSNLSWKEVCGRAPGSTNSLAVHHVWLFWRFSRPYIKKLQRLHEKPWTQKVTVDFRLRESVVHFVGDQDTGQETWFTCDLLSDNFLIKTHRKNQQFNNCHGILDRFSDFLVKRKAQHIWALFKDFWPNLRASWPQLCWKKKIFGF